MTTSSEPWHYASRGRRPAIVAAALLASGLTAFGIVQGAPWPWLVIVGLPAALLWLVALRDARFETRLDAEGLTMTRSDGTRVHVARDRIVRLEIVEWSDGTDARLVRDAGPPVPIPDAHRPGGARLSAAFAARGIPVEIR